MFKDKKIPIIIIMIITILIILCFTYEVHDNFSNFDLEPSGNRLLSYEEAIYKMQNPRIVICENETGLIAVPGDHKGPMFTSDCLKWYHISQVPRKNNDYVYDNLFNRDYDEYVYPWYNPMRWYYGSKPFYGYRRWNNPWRKWRGRNVRRGRNNPRRGKRGRSLMRGESPKRSRSLTRGGSPKRNRGTPKGTSVSGGKRGGGKRGGGASSRL